MRLPALCLAIPLFIVAQAASAVSLMSDGSDGAFHPTSSVLLDLPQDGVFNFTTIDIPDGVTVRFRANATNTPVVMLASGTVSVAGVIDLSAGGVNLSDLSASGIGYLRPATTASGGPGGGRGGQAGVGDTTCAEAACQDATAGTGPSPGQPGPTPTHEGVKVYGVAGGGGGMATEGLGATLYTSGVPGSAAIPFPEPFAGGSGGGGGSGWYFFGVQLGGGPGGGGGGAIHISTPGDITVSGDILALGANGGWAFANVGGMGGPGGGGSGGNIRLSGDTVTFLDSALVDATGGYGGGLSTQPYPLDPAAYGNGARGGTGYLLLEGRQVTLDGTLNAQVVVVPEPGTMVLLAGGLALVLAMGRRRGRAA